jgi:enamine deaminase RidA (YjgF/YER057c/UK114 family)
MELAMSGRIDARLKELGLDIPTPAAPAANYVKINGYVNSTPEFADHPKVMNGASDLLVEVFGDKGRHARAAVGVSSLPFDVAVEVDGVLEVL